jgi:hypothetical protein
MDSQTGCPCPGKYRIRLVAWWLAVNITGMPARAPQSPRMRTMVLDDMYARERFLFQLEWLLALEQRYHNVLQSGLVRVAYDPQDVHGLTFDAADAATQLGKLMACLKSSFRSTDLVAREGMNFWILTPFTQLDPVMDKVRHVLTNAPENGLAIAKSDIRVYLLRDHLKGGGAGHDKAQAFLAYLQQQPASVNLE